MKCDVAAAVVLGVAEDDRNWTGVLDVQEVSNHAAGFGMRMMT